MISILQKTKLLSRAMLSRMRDGQAPSVTRALPDVLGFLNGRRFGAPFAERRPAVLGRPIGGVSGKDIQLTQEEILEDLKVLYEALIKLATRTIDSYDIFSIRRDKLYLKINQYRLNVQTFLAQQSAGRRISFVDSFNTLDFVDAVLTTAEIDLDEGVASLPSSATDSIKYDGSRVKVTKVIAPPGTQEPGPSFETCFSPYRLDGWYANLPVGEAFVVHANVTGADYEKGATEEVLINAIRIEPTGPVTVDVDWSSDGFNWHNLNPDINNTIRDRATFHFSPILVGYLRFTVKHSEEITASNAGQIRPVGIKRIELFKRGFSSTASIYSIPFTATQPIHTVVAEIDADVPYGTSITSYVSQSIDGPWVPIQKDPTTFNTVQWYEEQITIAEPEVENNPASMWTAPFAIGVQPLPDTGEMVAGVDQIHISCFAFDWKKLGDPKHIPQQADFDSPQSEVRTGLFSSLGEVGTADITSSSFTDTANPVAVDLRNGSYIVFAVIQGNGLFSLQRGYTYRARSYVFCPTQVTLDQQKIGVVNTGGQSETVVAPLSLAINGRKVYEKETAAVSLLELSGSTQFQTTIALSQGWNSIDLYFQVPAELIAGQNGVGASDVFIYLQPNFFASNRQQDYKIDEVRAYADPWKRYSEFDLRYNVPIGVKESWAWKFDVENLNFSSILFNHDPTNSRESTTLHPSYTTLDGLNVGYPVALKVRYPTASSIAADAVSSGTIFFRADLVKNPEAEAPPVLRSYRLILN